MAVGIMRSGNAVSLGTGTTKTELTSAFYLPAGAKALLSVRGAVAVGTPTAAQTVHAKLEIESTDVSPNISPFIGLFAPIGAGLGATFMSVSDFVDYKINARVQGGEQMHIYGTALAANTSAPKAETWLMFSDNPGMMDTPMKHMKIGTRTSAGTTADTGVAGTSYQITNARKISDLFGIWTPTTIKALDYLIGDIVYTSGEFQLPWDFRLPLQPWTLGLGTTGAAALYKVSKAPVDIPVKAQSVNIQDTFWMHGVSDTAGFFTDGVVYE